MNQPAKELAFGSAKTLIETSDVQERIANAIRYYLCGTLGRPATDAERRTVLEFERSIAKSTLDWLARDGVSVANKRVLDIGGGMGAMAAELALRGAEVASVEPDEAWRLLGRDRLALMGLGSKASMLGAVGEHLPFRDESFDVVVSMKVLEHCTNVRDVFSEAWRVLKPGGHFYFITENYLGFWEPHYNVRWLPLLPKPWGSLYLRARGRNPVFLQQAIHYTTLNSVRHDWRSVGFISSRDELLRQAAHGQIVGPKTAKKKALAVAGQILPPQWVAALAVFLSTLSRVAKTDLDDLLVKRV